MLTGLDRIIGPFSLETMGRSGPPGGGTISKNAKCKHTNTTTGNLEGPQRHSRSKYSLLWSRLAERTIHEKLAAITDLLVKMMSGKS